MSYKVDFHMHSHYSDGSLSPTELVKKYKEAGYDIIALTDHDGIDGIREAQIAGEALELEVVSGIEMSVEAPDTLLTEIGAQTDYLEIHMLGYYIDIENEQLLHQIEELRQARKKRNEKLIALLNDMGVEMTLEELKKESKRDYVGKPNIARLMVKKGYVETPNDAFNPGTYMNTEAIRALKRETIGVFKAMDVISAAGGISVIAHPMKLKLGVQRGSQEFYTLLDKLLYHLKKNGLKGIECFHSSHSQEEALKLVELAEKYHLHITEGSDFHGDDWRVMSH